MSYVMMVTLAIMMADQMIAEQQKTTIYEQEDLQLHKIDESNEHQDTTKTVIKINEYIDVEMVLEQLKNNEMTITQYQVMAVALHASQKLAMHAMVETHIMHLTNEPIATTVKECIKITSAIQDNEYLIEEMAKGQVMRYVMMKILVIKMDVIQIDQVLKSHGYDMEAITQQKINAIIAIPLLAGIQMTQLFQSHVYQDEVMVRKHSQINGKVLKDVMMEIQLMKADLVTELELLMTIYVVKALQQAHHIESYV